MSLLGGLGPCIIAVMWVQTLLGFLFIALRLYCRVVLRSTGGWDDVFMVMSLVLLAGYTSFCTAAALNGFGQHFADLTLDEFAQANKLEIIGQTFCLIGIITSKAGVGVFQLRIVEQMWHKVVIWVTIFSVAVICLLVALFDFIRCSPIPAVWNPTIPAYCWVGTEAFTVMSITLSIISSAADFTFAVLPWFFIWPLQMSKNNKLLICCAMSFGVFAGVCGIVRAVALRGLSARSDYTYETVGLILWSSTELVVTIMTACIPTYRDLWINLFQDKSRSYFARNSGPNSYPLKENSNLSYNKNKLRKSVYHPEDQDDMSDRHILRPGEESDLEAGHNGIMKTNQVRVTIEPSYGPRTG